MKTKERKKVIPVVLVLVGLLGVYSFITAGNLEPSGAPGPTMKTLDEIYDAAASVSEREGYMQYHEVDPCSSETFFTVPVGKEFVLLKLCLRYPLYLTVNDNLLIDYNFFDRMSESGETLEDFPDRCVVVNASETLKVVNDSTTSMADVTIVGYFYDVE